jgi:uncharacterized protein with GYD domain
MAKKSGVNVKDVYWTLGLDAATILEAPDYMTSTAALSLQVG